MAQGEFVCLLGASGCGKSTLLNLVAGLDQPTSGTVDVRAERTGLMFQEAALFPWLTVRGNVEIALQARGGAAQRAARHARRSCSRWCTSATSRKRRPHELSGGMRQRAALARALAQDADVLLMDEPFGALDAMTRDMLHDELEALWTATGKTVLFVTHNVREAVRLGDRVVLLSSRPGRVVAELRRRHPPAPAHRLDRDRHAAATITDRLREEVRRASRTDLDARRRHTDRSSSDRAAARPSAPRAWAATWPKLLAIASSSAVAVRRAGRNWKHEYVVPAPFTTFKSFVDNRHHAPHRESGRCARGAQGFSSRSLIGGVVGVAVARSHDPARRDRLDDHRTADHAVDRVVPARASCCSTKHRRRSCSSSCSARRRRSPTACSTASTTSRRSCSAPGGCSARRAGRRCGSS